MNVLTFKRGMAGQAQGALNTPLMRQMRALSILTQQPTR